MDWTGCDLVEQITGKVSGQPIVRETRSLADGIIKNYQSGSPVEEICAAHSLVTLEAQHFSRVVVSE